MTARQITNMAANPSRRPESVGKLPSDRSALGPISFPSAEGSLDGGRAVKGLIYPRPYA